MTKSAHKGWNQRGYLPHFDASHTHQMITYRLADSLPKHVAGELDRRYSNDREKRKHIEALLDNGLGSCLLAKKPVSKIIIENWKFHNEKLYQLLAYVIMPNHLHLLIKQNNQHSLQSIVHAWKSYTSSMINKITNSTGPIWARDYWDRYIRDEQHFINAVHYILENPVKAGLVDLASDWELSEVL